MELKEYQVRTLDAFTRWRNRLTEEHANSQNIVAALEKMGTDIPPDIRNYPKSAWNKLAENGEVATSAGTYVERIAAAGYSIPHICFKLPTGGGKTLLGTAVLERMNQNNGLVLWMVPSNAIYRQTKAALWNREHPYRQMLERASGGRVKMLEKDDSFTAADVEHFLCVMLISLQSANRKKNKEFLRMFRDSGHYSTFFPDTDNASEYDALLEKYPDLERATGNGPVKHSLCNAFKILRPVIVLDEAHKAYGSRDSNSEKFVRSINHLNPSMVIELTATPSRSKSNLLVDISGIDLKREEMIKLPVQVTSFTNTEWKFTLGEAHALLEQLNNEAMSLQHSEGRYIRPIAVVRVERTGNDQQDGEHIHAEDVREHLTRNLGVPATAVAVQSATTRELTGVDLLSELSSIRWVITKAALMEGWDCPFAYLFVMLDNTKAQTAITQLVGRIMRQPHARLTGRETLDQCYVYCQDIGVNAAVDHVKKGLEQEGMTGLGSDVRGQGIANLNSVTIKRRERFRGAEIFFPWVLHQDDDRGWIELEYQRHIAPHIKWDSIKPPDIQSAQVQSPQGSTATVDLEVEAAQEMYDDPRELFIDTSIQIAWYARRISDVMPNPFRAARVVQKLIQQMHESGYDDNDIYGQRSSLVSQLREHITQAADKQAQQIFLTKLANKEIRFDLETSDHNHRFTNKPYEVLISEHDVQLQHYGHSVQLSLFEPVFDRDFNGLERQFAFYLDEQKALQWWHRVAVRQQGEYYLRGWRRERIWPDFVAMSGETNGKPSVLVFETKSELLRESDDTKYKNRVFAALEETFNAGTMTIHNGPAKGVFRLVFEKEGFPDAQTVFDGLNSS